MLLGKRWVILLLVVVCFFTHGTSVGNSFEPFDRIYFLLAPEP